MAVGRLLPLLLVQAALCLAVWQSDQASTESSSSQSVPPAEHKRIGTVTQQEKININKKDVVSSSRIKGSTHTTERRRTGIFVFSQMFSGSTAMLQLMMSAKVLTQCKANRWQCEEFRNWAWIGINATVTQQLECMAPYFDWEADKSHPLLMHKLGMPDHNILNSKDSIIVHLVNKGQLPIGFTNNGVDQIDPYVVILWDPHCMRNALSSHGPWKAEDFISDWQQHMDLVEFCKKHNVPFETVSFGDMIFHPQKVTKHLKKIPGISSVNWKFMPEMNVDIWPNNEWKTNSSVAHYAKQIREEAKAHYDPDSGVCRTQGFSPLKAFKNENGDPVPNYTEKEIKLLMDLEAELTKLGQNV